MKCANCGRQLYGKHPVPYDGRIAFYCSEECREEYITKHPNEKYKTIIECPKCQGYGNIVIIKKEG